MLDLANAAGLKLNNQRALNAAADEVAQLIESMVVSYDGSTMTGLDGLLPSPSEYKGTARKAASVN
jgi:hypothetical protein